MSLERHHVVATGLGAVSAIGIGCKALWASIEAGLDGIRPIQRFPTEDFTVDLGAIPPGWDIEISPDNPGKSEDICIEFAKTAAQEAWTQAKVSQAKLPPERIGLVLGTSLGNLSGSMHIFAESVADSLSANGPRITVSTACSSSTNALGLARDLLVNGAADLILAGGVDVLTPVVFSGFHALGVLSAKKCAPFSKPVGTTLGEGAGFVVLESKEQAAQRGVEALTVLSGYGLSADAYHETSPDPSGSGISRAISSALTDANLKPEHIGYVNVHGSGTAANDPAEWLAIQRVFGDRAKSIPISSTKSYFGHAQGAAGVLEIIATILAMQHDVVPPTLHFVGPRPRCPRDPVGDTHPRQMNYRHALCLNSAFGGANAAVIVSKPSESSLVTQSQDVHVLGVGALSPYGMDLSLLLKAIEEGKQITGRVPHFQIDHLVPTADPRGLDPTTCFLTAAASLALADGKISIHDRLRERTGLIVGTPRISPFNYQELKRSVSDRGLARLSATAFARIVLNAPSGSCSKLLSLKGPISTVTTDKCSGLTAIINAAQLLSERKDIDLIVSGGVEEANDLGLQDNNEISQTPINPNAYCEGAGCLVLASDSFKINRKEQKFIRMTGWGLAGPGRQGEAVERALQMAQMKKESIHTIFSLGDSDRLRTALGDWIQKITIVNMEKIFGQYDASAWACVAAVLTLRQGKVKTVLVTSGECRSVESALILRM